MPISLLQPCGGLETSLVAHLERSVQQITDELYAIQLAIHARPELAWKEHFAHDTCCDFMDKQSGFVVTRHAFGLQTAWQATFEVGTNGPVVGFNSEMDALRGLGHACGHNLIAVAGMAAAVATARLLSDFNIPGKVILLGTPAEESNGGKIYLLEKGAYDRMEVCMMTHPGPRGNGAGIPSLAANAHISVEYKGTAAHAGLAPSHGVNALDAAVAAYSSIGLLRQQMPDGNRINVVIRGSEQWASNIIPSTSELSVGVRASTAKACFELLDKVINCLKAGALATGCTYTINREGNYLDMQQASGLAKYLKEMCEETWGHEGYQVAPFVPTSGSSDFSNVSYRVPALHPGFGLPDAGPGDFPHTPSYASVTNSRSATTAALRSAVSLAAVASRVVIDRPWARQVRDDWELQKKAADADGVLKKMDQFAAQYPLSKRVSAAVCCGH